MQLSDATYEYIKGEVANIYKAYDIRKYPIVANDLATKMGFKVVTYSTLTPQKRQAAIVASPDGFYLEANQQEYIYVNDLVGADRRNMTIFHEIGHPVLGHDNRNLTDDIKEAEAKFFGKYLAAPPALIHLELPQSKSDLKICFGLSDEAAGYALEYYEKWKNKVRKCGLNYYDEIILKQFGIYQRSHLEQYYRSVLEVMNP